MTYSAISCIPTWVPLLIEDGPLWHKWSMEPLGTILHGQPKPVQHLWENFKDDHHHQTLKQRDSDSTFSSFYYHCGYPSFHHYVLMIFLVLLGAGCLFQAPYSTGLTFRELYYYIYHLVALVQSLSHVLLAATPYCSPPGSSVRGISQARILKWVATSFSRGSSWPGDWNCISCIGFFNTEPLWKFYNYHLGWV